MASPPAIEDDYDVPGLDPPISLESLYNMSHSDPSSQFDQFRPSTPTPQGDRDLAQDLSSPNMMAYLQFTPQQPGARFSMATPSKVGSASTFRLPEPSAYVEYARHMLRMDSSLPNPRTPDKSAHYGFLTPKFPIHPSENPIKSSPLFRKGLAESLETFRSPVGSNDATTGLAPAPIISSLQNDRAGPWASSPPYPPGGRSLKRSRSFDGDLIGAIEEVAGALDVIYSPVKGRRLKILHPGGEDDEEQHAISSRLVRVQEDARAPPEDAAILERRLAAFAQRGPPSSPGFIPVQWPGRGRVLMRSTPADPEHPSEGGEEDNFLVARRKELSIDLLPKHEMTLPILDIDLIRRRLIEKICWPDSEFPWNDQEAIRAREEAIMMRLKEAYIREWFQTESDEEDEDEQDEDLDNPEMHLRSRALGHSGGKGTESADAREVLLAQHNARLAKATTEVKSKPKPKSKRTVNRDQVHDSDEEDIKCVCNGGEDMGPMVCCDRCSTWYHQRCMGIEDESSLGENWYCAYCEAVGPPPQEPVLVPTVELPPCRPSSPQQPLYQVPLTPERRNRRHRHHNTPRHVEDLIHTPEPGPSRRHLDQYYVYGSRRVEIGKQTVTPRGSGSEQVQQRWITPGNAFEDTGRPVQKLTDSPFDPLSTPSRGLKFAVPLVAKSGENQDMFALRAALFTTPHNRVSRHAVSRRPVNVQETTPQSINWNRNRNGMHGNRRVRRRVDQVYEFGGELNVPEWAEQTPLRYERRSPTPDHVISAQDLEEYGMDEEAQGEKEQ